MIRAFIHCPVVALLALAVAAPLHGEERFLTLLFGPESLDTARQSSRAAAATAHRWLETEGSAAELRRAGSPDAQRIEPKAEQKDLEQAFLETALQARDTDPAAFLTALDAAVQAAALRSGKRIVVALLNSPPLSSQAEQTLEQMVEFCRSKGVRVIVVDGLEKGQDKTNAALATLATSSGGVLLQKAHGLETSVLMVAGSIKEMAAAAKPAPSAPALETPAPAAVGGFEIPVYTRFVRTSRSQTMNTGSVSHMGADSTHEDSVMVERAQDPNDATGPLPGLMLVESPLNALKFVIDDATGTYQARARVTSIVRNEKGEAVWTAQKEVNIHGPERRLEERRRGSLFLMRGVTLPSGRQYTLEAKVEDLVANSSGFIRTPLRTVQGARGLMASDALMVRRFSGSADRFEADQVLNWEGEALSPVLNAVFPADEPIRLRFYLIIYPDIAGSQPDLSFELLRDGRVVSRMPLQFKTEVNNLALDGKFGTAPGKGSTMMGGKSREFPYLADVNGAKLLPGTYEGVISIRQGRSVLTRSISFQVQGNAPALVAGPAAAAAAPVEEAVVLPPIEPATIDSSGLSMGPEEQKRIWDEAANNALGYSTHLPNFRCTQETHRFTAPVRSPDELKEIDSYKDELAYEDGKETYLRVEVDGAKPEEAQQPKTKAVHSRGEFGSMLRGLFEPEVGARYKWAGRAMAMGVLCQVFEVEVARPKSNLTLVHKDRYERVGYTGRVFIDEDTGLVRRLTIQGVDLPKDFVLQSPAFSLEYGMVRIGADDHLLPLRSVLQVQQVKQLVRNETVFRDYRRFEASTDIKFHNK